MTYFDGCFARFDLFDGREFKIKRYNETNVPCADQFFALKRAWRRRKVRQQDFSRILSTGYIDIPLSVVEIRVRAIAYIISTLYTYNINTASSIFMCICFGMVG